MSSKLGTGAANDNAKSFVNRADAREFRALRLRVFGRGALAEERAAEFISGTGTRCCRRTLQNWEGAHTTIPLSAWFRLRERLREVA